MNGRITGMDGVALRDAPRVLHALIHERIATLEVLRELEKSVVLIFDVCSRDSLLDDSLTPIFIKPRVRDLFLRSRCVQKAVLYASNVEIHLD